MKVLVAGIGNIFLGDDAFGCEVVKRLGQTSFPENVRVVDFGIRGFDLVYALMDEYDFTILVDAVPGGGPPGTVYEIEPDLAELDSSAGSPTSIETHGMDPLKVLRMAKAMGAKFGKLILVGCEPETFGPEEGKMGLSPSVAEAVDRGVQVVTKLVNQFNNENAQIWEGRGYGQEQGIGEST